MDQSAIGEDEFSAAAGSPDLSPLETLRHSTAHVMAHAVQRLFPGAKVTIGPHIDSGFYYDFDVEAPFTDEDLPGIESEMAKIIAGKHPFRCEAVTRDEALRLFSEMGESYKVEILAAIPADQTITLYRHDDFVDLCRGPHIEHTGQIKAFKLLSVAGAYWRGDSRNKMLSRIYGTAFPSQADLDAYLKQIEEAKRRDHRKLGKELDLIQFDAMAPGCVFWLPKGTLLWNTLSQWMRSLLLSNGYVEVRTPLIFNKQLWEISGHWDHYQDNMFLMEAEEQTYGLKPMNCPSHMLLYRSRKRSYRELPMRLHDQGVLHRAEPSGSLGGLTRVRQFCQDDAHLFVTPEQVGDEVGRMLSLIDRVYRAFDLTYQIKLSTRDPDKMIGDLSLWDRAEDDLRRMLVASGRSFIEQAREAAFYGPKIDFDVTDALGRRWQCATIQLDFQLPIRFDLSYVGEDNAEHRPVVVHRAIYGSFERFIALLIEHFAGAFPLWLSPVQAKVLGVSQKHTAFVTEVTEMLVRSGVRAEADPSDDKLGAKIRRAQLEKVPYMLVIGDKEVAARAVSPRARDGRQLAAMAVEEFAKQMQIEALPPPVLG